MPAPGCTAIPAGFAYDYMALEWHDELRASLQVFIEQPRPRDEEAGEGAPGGLLDGVQRFQVLWHRPSLLLAQESTGGAR